MDKIIDFIRGHSSGYTLLIILLASWLLIFVDRRQLIRKGLNREARFSFVVGIAYIVAAVVLFIVSMTFPT